jgi:large-conductance mechanosensitive channel
LGKADTRKRKMRKIRKMRGFAAAYRAAKKAEKQKELSWGRSFLMALFMFLIIAVPVFIMMICNSA